MKSFNEHHQGVSIFSQLIETILHCRLKKNHRLTKDINKALNKLNGPKDASGMALDDQLAVIKELHEECEFRVHNVFEKHFEDHAKDKYSIYLQIFTLHNKSKEQQKSSHFYQGHSRLSQKWVFHNETNTARKPNKKSIQRRSDLIPYILGSIKCLNDSEQESERGNNQLLEYNTTADDDIINKSYQIVIKSKCIKKEKFVTHVFHHQRNNRQPSLHAINMRTSLLDLDNYWEKTLLFPSTNTVTTVGCFYKKNNKKLKTTSNNQLPQSLNAGFTRQPDRKLSSQTKEEEKAKSSTSSFKFSLQNFPFSLNLNKTKTIKHGSAQLPIRKTSQQILHNHRPRYQSIYQSKDEQMNIFILSPRKLSDQQSPKAKHLQQKTIKFEIPHHIEHFVQGISEQVIEEFVLEPDENMSNVSSDGFEMLWDEGDGEMDKQMEDHTNIHDTKDIQSQKLALILQQIATIQATITESFKAFDNKFLFI